MDTNESEGEPAAPYHHGDLRRALLDAANEILVETGRWDFSLREVARRAGVSHAAPYRHFPDKEALLAEIGVSGFARLRSQGAAAVGTARGPRAVLAALGGAYVAFGVANPALYRLMFGRALPRFDDPSPALLAAVETARGVLGDVVAAGVRDGTFRVASDDPAAVRAATLGAWSLVHGLTLLTIDGLVRPLGVGDAPDADVRRVVEAFVDGLAAQPGPRSSGAVDPAEERKA